MAYRKNAVRWVRDLWLRAIQNPLGENIILRPKDEKGLETLYWQLLSERKLLYNENDNGIFNTVVLLIKKSGLVVTLSWKDKDDEYR